nr:hypothetical protein [Tanacetum cinerariifolium]
MKQDIAKQAAHDEKVVPTNDKVKIAKNNLRIYPSMTQTEENFQVALDILKNVPFYNVVLISAETKVRRCKIMPYPRFTKVITYYFMSQHKSITKREGSPYHTVVDDGLLDRLKFVNKGNKYQEDLPEEPTKPKQKPSKVTHANKEPVAPKKVTASSKKKLTKRNKKRVLKAVVIQEPPSAPFKQTYDSSGKLKGIKILYDVAQFGIDTLKAQKASRHESKLQPCAGGSSERTSSKPGVPDELTENMPSQIKELAFMTVIPEETQAPPPAAATTITLATQVPNIEVAVSDFGKHMLQDVIAKSLISLAQSSSSHQSAIETAKSLSKLELKQILYDKMLKSGSSCSHQTHEEIFNALTWSIKLDESRSTQSTKPNPIPKKRDRCDDDEDEDPSTGSNQGKETKKRRIGKETESLKKSSNPKVSSRGKPPSKPSKSGKSRSANDVVEETVFEIGSDDVDQTFDKKADDFEQPSLDTNTKQPSLDVVANLKRKKIDWYKKFPSPEPQDPDSNTVKKINDAQEHPWFKEMVNTAVPPLMFDELMSTPVDFSVFAINHLRLTTLT